MGAAAVMMMTACSSEEVINVAENNAAIGFSSFVDNSVRATDFSTENLPNDMAVYGVTKFTTGQINVVFNNQEVTRNGVGTGQLWSYSPVQYWIADNTYSFAAIAPYNATGVTIDQSTDAEKAMKDAGLTITFNNKEAEGNLDLLYANSDAANKTVEFSLGHMLSRVNFRFENNFKSDNYLLKVTDVVINDATSEATIDKTLGETTWTAVEKENAADAIFARSFGFESTDNEAIVKDGSASSETHYVIPLTDEKKHSVTFKVQLLSKTTGSDYVAVSKVLTHNVEIPAMKYINGYSYTFVASIDDTNIDPNNPDEPGVDLKPIEFTVTSVEGYDQQDDVTILAPTTPAE